MKHEFYTTRPTAIGNVERPAGTLVATVEVPEGVPVEKALAAIAGGHAVDGRPQQAEARAKKPAPPPAPLAVPVDAAK
jgi:hypothetical protein